jgi:phosphoglucomutase
MNELIQQVSAKAERWLQSTVVDESTKQSIRHMMKAEDKKELIDSFYKDLTFGTGGLRGIMGAGSNNMNRYTVGIATQGLSNYLRKCIIGRTIRVAIAFDSRNQSSDFARIAAEVFSANGIEVHLFPELRPTPLLSYAIRYLKCDSGVVITASHNPKEYNGYKAYWNDGAQVTPPHDHNIIREVSAIQSFEEVNFSGNSSLIHTITPEVEESYYRLVQDLLPAKELIQNHLDIPIVYSSLHGAGITMVPECLRRIGFIRVHVVKEQQEPDGNFPTVSSPNPEEKTAMELAIRKGKQINAVLVMATDPDTDRVGIGIRTATGEYQLLNGNQAFSLMMQFIMKHVSVRSGAYIAKTIVTTELVDRMAKTYGLTCYNTLTGFKYIAELMRELEGKQKFIAAGEESYGYMVGDFVRDKDAVSACAFFAVLAATAVSEGKSLEEALIDMYVQHGFYYESLFTLTKKGQQGEQEIKSMMQQFRHHPPAEISGVQVIRVLDYETLMEKNLLTGTTSALKFPASDVLQFYLQDGSKVSVRPSGTEPKIKFYISVHITLPSREKYEALRQELDNRVREIERYLRSL